MTWKEIKKSRYQNLNTFRFSKIFQNRSEDQTNIPRNFLKFSKNFPKIFKDCRRLSRKSRRCFNHTPTNISTINLFIKRQTWLHQWGLLWKIWHFGPGCSFTWILQVVYFPVRHLCLYNKYNNYYVTLIGMPVQWSPNGNRHLFPFSLSYPVAN